MLQPGSIHQEHSATGTPRRPRFRNLHPLRDMASRLFAETNDRHCRRSPPPPVVSFRLQSLPYRYGIVFLLLPPQDDASLTPSPTSARIDPASTPPNNQLSACS